jgi:hypothetical protein
MIRRSTWILLLIFALLLGFAWYLNRPKPVEPVPDSISEYESPISLFGDNAGEVVSFQIKGNEQTVGISREEGNGWVFTDETHEGAVDQSIAESAASQLTALLLIEEKVVIAPQYVGLKPPEYEISVKFSTGETHTLYIGDETPSGSGYYVQLDEGNVAIVDYFGIRSMLSLLDAPPYAPTPTESPSP